MIAADALKEANDTPKTNTPAASATLKDTGVLTSPRHRKLTLQHPTTGHARGRVSLATDKLKRTDRRDALTQASSFGDDPRPMRPFDALSSAFCCRTRLVASRLA